MTVSRLRLCFQACLFDFSTWRHLIAGVRRVGQLTLPALKLSIRAFIITLQLQPHRAEAYPLLAGSTVTGCHKCCYSLMSSVSLDAHTLSVVTSTNISLRLIGRFVEESTMAQQLVRSDLVRVGVAASQILRLLLLGIVSVFFLLMFLMWSCGTPSDTTLRSQFQSHRSELDTLARMSQEDADGIRITDNVTRLEKDWGWARPNSKKGITREKWNQYRRLFREVELSGLDKDKVGNVYFVAATDFAAGGTTKGFVHCINFGDRDKTFLPCVAQHDRGQVEGAGDNGYSYRKLGQNWYIFETWDKAVPQ